MAQNGRALTPFAANVISILIIAFFTPLIMGWGMTSSFERQTMVEYGPENGSSSDEYAIINSGNCSMTNPLSYQSSYNIVFDFTSSISPLTNGTSEDTPHDSFKGRINQGVSSPLPGCGGGPYEYTIPSNQFVNPQSNISSFYFRVASGTSNSGIIPIENTSNVCSGEYTFDARLRIQGDIVIEEYRVNSNDCLTYEYDWYTSPMGNNPSKLMMRSIAWNPQFTPVESYDISEKISQYGCGLSCNITVELDRIVHSQNNTNDAFLKMVYVQSATYEVDFEERNFKLGLSAWILAAFLGLATIASTPLWDPFKRHVQNLGSYDL